MTATTPPSGSARRRAGARAVAAIAAALLLLAPASPALAAASPSPTPTPGTIEFDVAALGSGVLHAGGALSIAVSLRNGTETATEAATATISLGTSPLASRAAVAAWLDGSLDVALQDVATASVPATEGGADAVAAVSVPAADPRVAALQPGVYPLRAESAGIDAVSVVVVPRTDAAAVAIGVVVPITAPPRTTPLIPSDELAELTAADGELTSQLDGVAGTPAILAVDPAIPASIRVLGASAPQSAQTWLTRLMGLDNERFALQFGDADVAVQLAAGQSKPAPPLSLQRYLRAADFPAVVPTPDPDATPSPTPTPSGPAFPPLAELLDIGPAIPDVYWPAPGDAGPDILGAIASLADGPLATTTLIPSSAVNGPFTVPARARLDDAGLLVYDDPASLRLSAAASLDDSTLRSAQLAAASAELWFATEAAAGSPLLIALDRDADRSRAGLRAAITAATQDPGTDPVALSALLGVEARTVTVKDAAPSRDRIAAAKALVADEARVARFASVLDAPVLLTGSQRAQTLQVLGVPWLADTTAWTAAYASVREATEATLDSVDLVQPTPLNLISSGAGLPFWVRNDLPFPVNVVLYTTSDDLRLDVQQATVITAQPRTNTAVDVPVKARIGSGDVQLELQLRSPTSEPIGTVKYVTVSVRAEWEAIGGTILGVVVTGLLVVGVVRTFIRRRRARQEDA